MKKTKKRDSLPPQLREPVQLLRRGSTNGVQVSSRFDASAILEELAISVDRAASTLSSTQVRMVHAALHRWHTKILKKYRTIRYSDPTVRAAESVLFSATDAYLRRLSAASIDNKGKDFRRLEKHVRGCVDTIICICAYGDELSWRYPIIYLRRVSKAIGVDFVDFLSPDFLGQNYSKVESGAIRAIEVAIDRGEVDQVELLFASVSGHDLKDSMIAVLSKLLSDQAARLPSEVQQSIMSLIGVSPGTQSAEYVNPAESPQAAQLAAFLLHLWDEAQNTSTLEEIFQRFRLLCEKEFKLFLHGAVEAEMDFDPRVHEGKRKLNGHVKLLRPWVELIDPPHAYVVIRGLVEPIDS